MIKTIVQSSNIKFISYDVTKSILIIEFLNNEKYVYFDVPAQIYKAFLSAESKGSYANKNIYKQFNFIQIKGGESDGFNNTFNY